MIKKAAMQSHNRQCPLTGRTLPRAGNSPRCSGTKGIALQAISCRASLWCEGISLARESPSGESPAKAGERYRGAQRNYRAP
jgi:hypothetical protein